MNAGNKDFSKDLKYARNFIIVGLVLVLFSLYPILLINVFPEESDLIKIKDVLISKGIKNQNRGGEQLELTLKTYPEKLHVSDLALTACENCLDFKIGDSIFLGIAKEIIIRNKVYSMRNKQKEVLILEDYRSVNKHNNKKFILFFVFGGLITIGLGIWMRMKIMASVRVES